MGALELTTGYLESALHRYYLVRDQACTALKDVDYDTIVGTGLSGALVIPRLASDLQKNPLIIRKPGDNTHSFNLFEGTIGRRWVFVDDLIDSGATVYRAQRIIESVIEDSEHFGHETEFIGTFLYHWGEDDFIPAGDETISKKARSKVDRDLPEYLENFGYRYPAPDHIEEPKFNLNDWQQIGYTEESFA